MYWVENSRDKNFMMWKGMRIDFDAMYAGLKVPDCQESDYEDWRPSSTWSPIPTKGVDNCLLGNKATISKRKKCSFCRNLHPTQKEVIAEACPCTPQARATRTPSIIVQWGSIRLHMREAGHRYAGSGVVVVS